MDIIVRLSQKKQRHTRAPSPSPLYLGQAQEERESLERGERRHQDAAEELWIRQGGLCTAIFLEGETVCGSPGLKLLSAVPLNC